MFSLVYIKEYHPMKLLYFSSYGFIGHIIFVDKVTAYLLLNDCSSKIAVYFDQWKRTIGFIVFLHYIIVFKQNLIPMTFIIGYTKITLLTVLKQNKIIPKHPVALFVLISDYNTMKS